MEKTTCALVWAEWQREIVHLLSEDLSAELSGITIDDVDWSAWRDYYTDGKSPRRAIDRAFERDL
jgi:hypothetical protein